MLHATDDTTTWQKTMLRQYTHLWVWSPWNVSFWSYAKNKGPMRYLPSWSRERKKRNSARPRERKKRLRQCTYSVACKHTSYTRPSHLQAPVQLAALAKFCRIEACATSRLMWSRHFSNASRWIIQSWSFITNTASSVCSKAPNWKSGHSGNFCSL